jgi:hypothetical protein
VPVAEGNPVTRHDADITTQDKLLDDRVPDGTYADEDTCMAQGGKEPRLRYDVLRAG